MKKRLRVALIAIILLVVLLNAQFGNYGKQKGDSDATISREEQQNITVEAINKFIAERKD